MNRSSCTGWSCTKWSGCVLTQVKTYKLSGVAVVLSPAVPSHLLVALSEPVSLWSGDASVSWLTSGVILVRPHWLRWPGSFVLGVGLRGAGARRETGNLTVAWPCLALCGLPLHHHIHPLVGGYDGCGRRAGTLHCSPTPLSPLASGSVSSVSSTIWWWGGGLSSPVSLWALPCQRGSSPGTLLVLHQVVCVVVSGWVFCRGSQPGGALASQVYLGQVSGALGPVSTASAHTQ